MAASGRPTMCSSPPTPPAAPSPALRSTTVAPTCRVGGDVAAPTPHRPGRADLPSRPGEFHPEPLTDPDMNLSIHPARAIHRRLPPSVEIGGLLRSPVARRSNADGPLPSLRGHYPTSALLRRSPPLPGPSVFRPHGLAACAFSLGIARQVLKFRARAWIRFTPSIHRTPLGQYAGLRHALPGGCGHPRF